MKKFLSILFVLVLLLSLNSGVSTLAAAETPLTAREKAIADAYVKSYESGNLSGIKKYIYTGSKMTVDSVLDTTDVKIFSPKYSKKYDAKVKMNCILISCIVVRSDSNNLTLLKGTIGINLKTKNKTGYVYSENITMAELDQITRHDITETQANDIATYIKKTYGEADVSKIPLNNPKASSAAIDSPAAFGSTYTYNGLYNYKKDSVDGTFAITINNVTDVTLDEAKSMGYKGLTNENLEYKLVNITWEVIKAKVTKGTGSIYTYRDFIEPIFRGSEAPGVDYINIVTDDGFTGSFKSKFNDELNSDKLKSNSTARFAVTGNVILPVIKETENYMVFIVKGEEDPKLDRIYFKLK